MTGARSMVLELLREAATAALQSASEKMIEAYGGAVLAQSGVNVTMIFSIPTGQVIGATATVKPDEMKRIIGAAAALPDLEPRELVSRVGN